MKNRIAEFSIHTIIFTPILYAVIAIFFLCFGNLPPSSPFYMTSEQEVKILITKLPFVSVGIAVIFAIFTSKPESSTKD